MADTAKNNEGEDGSKSVQRTVSQGEQYKVPLTEILAERDEIDTGGLIDQETPKTPNRPLQEVSEKMKEDIDRVVKSFARRLELAIYSTELNSTIQPEPTNYPREELWRKELELKQKEIELLRRELEVTTTVAVAPAPMGTRSQQHLFTFQDVEGSMNKFNGGEGYRLERWIQDIEDAAETYGWSDVQRTVYAKRLLEGDAKMVLRTSTHIAKWEVLKAFLRNEFQPVQSSATVHGLMAKRRKRAQESFTSYLIAMMELGATIKMEETSIVQYCIAGIEDYEVNKAILYGATTIAEFKKKLCLYEEIKSKTSAKSNVNSGSRGLTTSSQPKSNKRVNQGIKCFLCGELGHIAGVCPQKGKGSKCFQCKEFGHIASKCTKAAEPKGLYAVEQESGFAKRSRKRVTIEGVELETLIDSGSDLNFIAEKILALIGYPEVTPRITKFRGIGSEQWKTIGCTQVQVEIDGERFKTRFHVVKDGVLPVDVILGHELLVETVTVMTPNEIKITKILPELASMAQVVEKPSFEMGDIVNKNLRAEIIKRVERYQPNNNAISQIIKMRIILRDETPISCRPRRLSPLELNIVRNQVDEWLREEIIRPSCSEYASQIVLANKKDGTKRICIDYRKLNKVIVRDRYPLPLMEEQINKLRGATMFSTLDLRNGFFHVPIEENSIKFTAFVTPFGQYEFLRAPFGLCNSPAAFQRFVNNVFKGLSDKNIVCVYMDDLIIPAKSEEESVARIEQVLEVAERNGLQIKWSKCRLMMKVVEYLGYEIESGLVRPSKSKQKAIKSFAQLNNVRQIQRFLGLTGYFRKFVEGYALLAKPLTDLLRKDVPFQFGKEQEDAVKKLKDGLTSTPVLRMYSMEAETEVHTDACKYGVGAILLQRDEQDKEFHPVFFYSRKTSDCEERYCGFELEVLAIVKAMKKFRVYLLGLKFKIVTDCAAFKGTMERKEINSRIAGWALTLQEFEYELEHRAGRRMKHVDALSRSPILLWIEADVINQVKAAQKEDSFIQAIGKLLQSGPYNNFSVANGLVFKEVKGAQCIVVPRAMQTEVIRMCHNQGHFGTKKTAELVEREFYIEQLGKKVAVVIRNCVHCILINRKEGKQDGWLNPIPKGNAPLQTYHIDHLGHLTATRKGYKYILCVIDGFTKFVWLYPTKTTSCKEVIQKLEVQKAVFGNPKVIVSDRGTAFTAIEFKEYCKEEKIDHHTITTGMPSGNGQVERINRVIIPVLAKLAREDTENWWKYVERVQMCINNSYQKSIGRSPFELLMGTKMKLPDDLRVIETIEKEWIEMFEETREEMREDARKSIERMQKEYKRNFDRRRKKAPKYKIGDWVVVKKTQFGVGQKIATKYVGPYEVTAVKENDRYDVTKVNNKDEGSRNTTASAEHMKRYFEGWSDSERESEEGEAPSQEGRNSSETEQRHQAAPQESGEISSGTSDFLGFDTEEESDHPGRMASRMAE